MTLKNYIFDNFKTDDIYLYERFIDIKGNEKSERPVYIGNLDNLEMRCRKPYLFSFCDVLELLEETFDEDFSVECDSFFIRKNIIVKTLLLN